MPPQQIQGLPPGAELRPIQGLPEGAELRHIDTTPPDTAAPPDKGLFDQWNDFTKPLTEIQPHQMPHSMGDVGREIGKGVGNIGAAAFGTVLHPWDTAVGMAKSTLPPVSLYNDVSAMAHGQAPPSGEQASQILHHPFEAAESMAGQTAAMGGLAKIKVPEIIGGYKSPVIPAELQNASKLATAIRPPGGINASLEGDLASEMPKIRGYAMMKNNPFHSQWEGAHAARGLAEEGLGHFKEEFLEPYSTDRISMKGVPEYQGPVGGEGNETTLGDIHNRIVGINKQLRGPMGRAKTTGAEISEMDRIGLENEHNKLAQMMNRHLSAKTGVPPEQIDALRQGYGKQFGIADTIDSARRARLGPMGAQAEGGTTLPTSKTGLLDKAFTAVRGGQQYLADRNFRKAANKFEPVFDINYPSPTVQHVLEESRVPLWTGPSSNPAERLTNVESGPGLSTPESLGRIKAARTRR